PFEHGAQGRGKDDLALFGRHGPGRGSRSALEYRLGWHPGGLWVHEASCRGSRASTCGLDLCGKGRRLEEGALSMISDITLVGDFGLSYVCNRLVLRMRGKVMRTHVPPGIPL